MLAPTQVWAFSCCMVTGVWRYLQNSNKVSLHLFFIPILKQETMEYSIQNIISKTGLPLIVTKEKPNLCFLIDTGSTHNLLFSFVYEHCMSFFTETNKKNFVMGLDGEPKETIQTEGNLTFGNHNTIVSFSVIDSQKAVAQIQAETGIQIHGILGMPFLLDNKLVLDFNKLKITSI